MRTSIPIQSDSMVPAGGPRLLDRVRQAIRVRHYSPRTEKAYVGWIRRFIVFHGKRRPNELGEKEVSQFLSSLATVGRVSASTQNQALSAVLFLYGEVLGRQLEWMDGLVRARRPMRVPLVLSRAEVAAVLGQLRDTPWLMGSLLYGSGLRIQECCWLRVKDVDFERQEIAVRDSKWRKDHVTMLPAKLQQPLAAHLAGVKRQHEADLRASAGSVALPGALRVKYPRAAWEWGWHWVFPATRFHRDRETGERRRHHLHESVLQKAFKEAVRVAGLAKPASCPSLRHYAGSRTMPSDGRFEFGVGPKLHLETGNATRDRSA